MENFSPEISNKLSATIGENPANTQKAISSAIPSLLGGLLNTASTNNGVGIIENVFKMASGNEMSSNLEGTLNNDENSNLVSKLGTSVLSGLFGNKTEAIAQSIASTSGIQSSSATKLLGMITPFVMSKLHSHATTSGLGVSGLLSALGSQKDSFLSLLPSGFANVLGLGSIASLGSNIGGITKNIGNDVKAGAGKVADEGSSIMKWLLPLLLVLLLGVALWYFLKGCNTSADIPTTGGEVTNVLDSLQNDVKEAGDNVNQTISNAGDSLKANANAAVDVLGAFFKKKLANGTELNIPENGTENKLLKFIEDANRPVDKTTWFTMDRILFETGKSTLKKESDEQINNIVEVLKAYPNVNIKIGGYTDNTGDADANLKLSEARAKTVMNAIINKGIQAGRLSSEGYGKEHPVATNDTEEGRQKNRRIDIRVTKK